MVHNKQTTVITVLPLRAKWVYRQNNVALTEQESMRLPAGLHKNQQTNKQMSNLNMVVPVLYAYRHILHNQPQLN